MSDSWGIKGMTLVELMVAIAITSVVMAMSISLFISQKTSYEHEKSIKEAQESGQAATEAVKTNLMEAGWSVRPEMAFFFEDGGAGGSDRIYINDTSIVNVTATSASGIPLLLASDNCSGCRKIMSGSGSSSIGVGRLDIDDQEDDGDATGADFVGGVSQYVISCDADSKTVKTPEIAKINNTGGTQLSLDRPISGTHVAPVVFYCADADGTDASCHPSTGPTSTITAVLRRSDRSTGALQPMVENVVDLQVAYQDTGGNWYGAAGCGASGLGAGFCSRSPFEPLLISLIRISVVTQSRSRMLDQINNSRYCRPALENHAGAVLGSSQCGYVYRTYTALVQPRSTGPMYNIKK